MSQGSHPAESYRPCPIDTAGVELPSELVGLRERLAEHVHDVWAQRRLAEGWSYGPRRDDVRKQSPCLVAFAALPEDEKEYDRQTAIQTLKAILALGYRIGR